MVLAAAVGLAACRTATAASERAATAICAARVLDARSGRYSGPAVILVDRGRITRVLAGAGRCRAGVADSVIDLGDLTVLPGLIDAHVHLAIGGPVRANALANLRAGFTTVVDQGALTHRILRIRDSMNLGAIEGPRVLAAGIWVGAKGGVCEFTGIGIAPEADAFRRRVRENVEAGADLVKLCVTGWPAASYARPDQYEVTDDVLAAAVDEARRGGRLVVAHAIGRGGALAASRAGVNGLAHAAYLDSSAASELRGRGTFVVSTLASLVGSDTSAASRALAGSVGIAYRIGVPIVFGTDAGVIPHGGNAAEFLALERVGVSRLDAVRAATVNAARAFRLADSLGVVGPGMIADLIGVEGDPLADLAAMSRVRFVMSRGRVARALGAGR